MGKDNWRLLGDNGLVGEKAARESNGLINTGYCTGRSREEEERKSCRGQKTRVEESIAENGEASDDRKHRVMYSIKHGEV